MKDVVSLYNAGFTPIQIGRQLKMDRFKVLNELHKAGVKRRPLDLPAGARSRLETMLKAGADYRTIAKQMGISCEVAKLVTKGHPY